MIPLLLLISSKKYQNIIRCKFRSNCSLFLISTLNISCILYLAMFFKKISMAMSQQPIWQIICNSSNKSNTHTHTLESLHIFLEANYKLVPWLKKFEKVCSSSFICIIRNFKSAMWQRTVFQSVTRIALPELHLLISYLLEGEFSFSSVYLINIIIFICTPRISAEAHSLLLSATY